jgi:hypothetical protein
MSESLARSQAAAKYKPGRTLVLFVAEAPPNDLERYFYFEDVKGHDWLWLALMKALFARDFGETRLERKRKAYWLARFRDGGYQLVDAVEEPISGSNHRRLAVIKENADRVLSKIRAINPPQVVLIKHTVFSALCTKLQESGIHILNDTALPFPSCGRQAEFSRRLLDLIGSGQLSV